jgi:hypothetical protein
MAACGLDRRHFSSSVLGRRHWLQVVRVHARRVAAKVVEVWTIVGDRAHQLDVCPPVREV